MKTKDVLIVVAAIVLIGVSIFLIFNMLGSSNKTTQQPNTSVQTTETKLTGEIDKETLKAISDKTDYGEATLDNIGRTNPFGPLN